MSASFSIMSAPSSSTIVLVIWSRNISSAVDVPTARLVDIVLTYGVHTYNSYICAQSDPNAIWCSSMNSKRVSAMTSLTVSLMSCRSSSVRVIESKEVFEYFNLFCGPIFSLRCCHFNYVDIFYGSPQPSSVFISYSDEGDFSPPRSSSVAFYYSSAAFTVYRVALALATTTSFQCFSANCDICYFSSSFFLYMAYFSASTMELARVHHFDNHDSRTAKMTTFVAR